MHQWTQERRLALAMYKGPASNALFQFTHWFTCLWTGSDYSHCELVFGGPNERGLSLCASASARDGGVRFKHIDLNSGHWDFYPLPQFSAEDYARAMAWTYANNDAKYDWLGLLWFVLPARFEHPRRYFCSEAVGRMLGLPEPYKLHPQRLLDRLMAARRKQMQSQKGA